MEKSLENYKEFERKKDSDLMKILKDYVAFQTKNAQKVCIHFIMLLNDKIITCIYIQIWHKDSIYIQQQ